MMIRYKRNGDVIVICDKCGKISSSALNTSDALFNAENIGWATIRRYGEWENWCNECYLGKLKDSIDGRVYRNDSDESMADHYLFSVDEETDKMGY